MFFFDLNSILDGTVTSRASTQREYSHVFGHGHFSCSNFSVCVCLFCTILDMVTFHVWVPCMHFVLVLDLSGSNQTLSYHFSILPSIFWRAKAESYYDSMLPFYCSFSTTGSRLSSCSIPLFSLTKDLQPCHYPANPSLVAVLDRPPLQSRYCPDTVPSR